VNPRRVLSILGLVLYALAGAQLLPLALALLPLDPASARGFGVGIGASLVTGFAFRRFGTEEGELYRRDGVLIVAGSWLLASVAGALPYVASGAIPHLTDALFESTSGFSTTGASILLDIEALPRAMLFWRSQTQWLGGVGLVVIFVALLSELGPGARFLFKLEVPGPKAEVLHNRVRETATVLFRIYLGLTVAEVLLLVALGLSVYDAVVHSFSTLSTGGFSPYSDSVAHFSPAVQAVILVFMLAAGVNFSLYYLLGQKRDPGVLLRDTEVRAYLGLVAAGVVVVLVDFLVRDIEADFSLPRRLLDVAFQVVSVLTTTGFATADFADWPAFSRSLLVALMLVGGCAGSTAGGAKIIRLLIAWTAAMREVRLTFSPNSVVAVTVGRVAVPEESVRAVVALLLMWFVAWGAGSVLLSIGEMDIVTAATAAIATLSNIGPGLSAVGPTGNFAFFAPWQKIVMLNLMLLGRLEFFALLALVQPRFWRR